MKVKPEVNKRHIKYRLPNGFTFYRSKTPSDHRASMNALHELRKLIGRDPWET